MRPQLILVRLSLAVAGFALGCCRPNILFVVVDDLRPALGACGDASAVSPSIDALRGAAGSVSFQNAFAQQALCAPSRNSFLTSRRPDTLHLYDFYNYWRHFAGNFTTLPQLFKENGYQTFSIGKVFHPGISSNDTDDYPYSWSEMPYHPSTDKYANAATCVGKDGKLAENLVCPVVVEEQPEATLPDLQSYLKAKSFLSRPPQEPFFLAVGFHKPHVPFKYPNEYLRFHPIDKFQLPSFPHKPYDMPDVAWSPWNDVRRREDIVRLNISYPFGRMPDAMTKRISQSYYAAVTYVDDLIGKLLGLIDRSNTIIVLFGDHGWSLGEHGEFAKFSNFDAATRVPLIIHAPNFTRRPLTVDSIVELVDLLPTLAELANLGEVKQCQEGQKEALCTEGRSLLPLMRAARSGSKPPAGFKDVAFSQYPRPGPYPSQHPDSDVPKLKDITIMGYSIRTPRHRYTRWVKFNSSNFKVDWDKVYGEELYDLAIDAGENLNLANREALFDFKQTLYERLRLGWRYA